MAGFSLECTLMLAYPDLACADCALLDGIAGHAHRRSLAVTTAGFTYHSDCEVWKCSKRSASLPGLLRVSRRKGDLPCTRGCLQRMPEQGSLHGFRSRS